MVVVQGRAFRSRRDKLATLASDSKKKKRKYDDDIDDGWTSDEIKLRIESLLLLLPLRMVVIDMLVWVWYVGLQHSSR